MILTLRAVSLNDQPLTRPITARFDSTGGTIGRADHSTLALPDPERFISRKQAEIVYANGGFLIRNVGAANSIGLSKRSLALGESAMLVDGDNLRIGGYQLHAELSTEALRAIPAPEGLALTSAPVVAPFSVETPARSQPATRLVRDESPAAGARPAAPPSVAPPPAEIAAVVMPPPQSPAAPALEPKATPASSANPFADLLGDFSTDPVSAPASAGSANPFADLLAAPSPTVEPNPFAKAAASPFGDLLPPAAGLTPRSAAVAAPVAQAPLIPDDFDPFAAPAAAVPTHGGRVPDDPFAALAPGLPQVGIDEHFGLGAHAGARAGGDPLADFEFKLSAGAQKDGALSSVDPLAMFENADDGAQRAADDRAGRPMQDDLPGVYAAFEPPRVGPIAASSPPREVAQSLDARLWQAFCEGAGVRIDLPNDPALAAARMHQVGRLLSAAVAGTRELMVVRASTKYELRAEVTQIQARGNNPLKFAPDLRTGVEQLVQPATRGFLEGPAAMEDAMRDLVGHSIGSVAGMRAALEGLLDRFDPAALEETLGAGSVLDSLVPLSRRAKLWELYRQRFRDLRDEAQENFHALFGKAFVAAYEQQVDQLRKSAQVGSSPSAGEK